MDARNHPFVGEPPFSFLTESTGTPSSSMPREIVTIECTEARKEGKSPSRYQTTRNKKLQTEKIEKKKFNPALRRHTVHREIK